MASALMLEHVGRQDLATRLRTALDHTLLVDKVRTRDLGGTANTADFATAVLAALG